MMKQFQSINANTPGYTRQEAVITASDPYTSPTLETKLLPGQLGTGALATMIRRIRNEYLPGTASPAGSIGRSRRNFSAGLRPSSRSPETRGSRTRSPNFLITGRI